MQQQSPSIDLVEALARLDLHLDPAASTAGRYLGHLEQSPSLIAASRWLDLEKLQQDPHRDVVDRALDKAIRPLGDQVTTASATTSTPASLQALTMASNCSRVPSRDSTW